jgi:hypothetical protein
MAKLWMKIDDLENIRNKAFACTNYVEMEYYDYLLTETVCANAELKIRKGGGVCRLFPPYKII